MSTRALIDRIVPRVGTGWSRSTGNRSLLKLVEQGLDTLYELVTQQRIYIPTDNQGFPPYLKTVAGTYEYEIIAANLGSALSMSIDGSTYTIAADNVLRVFIDATSNDYEYDRRWIGEPFLMHSINPYTQATSRLFAAVIPINSTPGYENTPPRVRFVDDPGTSTTKYFVEFTWKPPRLTSESIPLPIPLMYEQALEDFVMGKVQESDNGSPSQLTQRFLTYWLPMFRRNLNSNAKAKSNQTLTRLC